MSNLLLLTWCKTTVICTYIKKIAFILRIPVATASSFSILNVPSSLVFATCGPPQNSIENASSYRGLTSVAPSGPMEYTDTCSGYFTPNSCSAPSVSASAFGNDRQLFRNSLIDDIFHLCELLRCHLCVPVEIDTQSLLRNIRAALLHMGAEYHLQCFQ